MALIYCPECNQSVSDTALVCPHCGYSIKSFTDEQRAKDEIFKLAESVKQPSFPLFDPFVLLDLFLVIMVIVIAIAFNVRSYPKIAISGLIAVGIIQVFLLPQIIKKIKEYKLSKTNFEEYQVKMVLQDIKKYSKKRATGIYFLSFVIPIIGFIMSAKNDEDDNTYSRSTCLALAIISLIIDGLIYAVSQL